MKKALKIVGITVAVLFLIFVGGSIIMLMNTPVVEVPTGMSEEELEKRTDALIESINDSKEISNNLYFSLNPNIDVEKALQLAMAEYYNDFGAPLYDFKLEIDNEKELLTFTLLFSNDSNPVSVARVTESAIKDFNTFLMEQDSNITELEYGFVGGVFTGYNIFVSSLNKNQLAEGNSDNWYVLQYIPKNTSEFIELQEVYQK